MENLLALLMQARDVAHIHHWQTKSFARHMALGELYELLQDTADELAEMSFGAHGTIGDPDPFQPTGWDRSDPLAFVTQMYTVLENLKGTIPQDDWLINKYEELQGNVARIKYKLENLH